MIIIDDNLNVKLQNLSKKLSDLISGSSITRLFQVNGMVCDLSTTETKYKRIFNAFAYELSVRKSDQKIIRFIENIFDLSHYGQDLSRFKNDRESVNSVLIYMGCLIDDSGKIISTKKPTNIDEAASRLNNLKNELEKRNIHFKVMKYCSVEYLANDYFHACFEAIKGLYKEIKELVNLDSDGENLIDRVFSKEKPLICINNYQTASERNEFFGFKNLLLFLHKSIRNFEAHETRLNNDLELEMVLDLFVCVSIAYKYLDRAQLTCFVN